MLLQNKIINWTIKEHFIYNLFTYTYDIKSNLILNKILKITLFQSYLQWYI